MLNAGVVKELPHNARGPLAGVFQPLAACKNLDYPGGKSKNLQEMTGGKGTARCAAVLCGSSLTILISYGFFKID